MFIKKNKAKIFCIGSGKTGTTSVEKALKDFGYTMGDQASGELLVHDYAVRNFKPLIKLCKTADAFQDAPFCFKHTYVPLDVHFPNSKFILTVRDSAIQWYDSLVKFHTKMHGVTSNTPTVQDLKNATYRYKGYAWDVRSKVFGFSEYEDPYHKQKLIDYYNSHNASVIDYFKNRKDLLIINLSDETSYQRLCAFLDRKPLYDKFPWKNKTSEL